METNVIAGKWFTRNLEKNGVAIQCVMNGVKGARVIIWS